jgi:O-acetyl-ADP-ribose deacetylase (regulator of RNase III)
MNEIVKEIKLKGGQRLQIVRGDLTQEAVDAIVNAANAQLQHGGGVAGAISRRGGPQIQEESDEWVRRFGPVSHARPVYTKAGELPCRFVIHAVGPVWGSGDEDAKLEQAVQGSLRVAGQLGLASIAMPAISTGIYGFPKGRAAEVILSAIGAYFSENRSSAVEQVRLTLIDPPTVEIFVQTLERLFSGEASQGEP